jgi:hypothetical protein
MGADFHDFQPREGLGFDSQALAVVGAMVLGGRLRVLLLPAGKPPPPRRNIHGSNAEAEDKA